MPRRVSLSLLFAGVIAVGTYPLAATDHGPTRTTVGRVVVHAIGGPECKDGAVVFSAAGGNAQSWKTYFEQHAKLGIHYVIDRAGTVAASIPENQIANHAKNNNSDSIGIELVNKGDGADPYPTAQIDALVTLLKQIRTRWSAVGASQIVTHSAVDTETFECGGQQVKRKQDPGPLFPLADVRTRATS